jgi:hypothetical protein
MIRPSRIRPWLCLLGCLLAIPARLVAAEAPGPWAGWEMLLGDWIADASQGKPGAATSGSLSFTYDLDRHVIVRRDRADYPALAGRPAFSHQGLTVIAPDAAGAFHASSFDNEGHVIEYDVQISPGSIVFLSAAKPGAPRFRLTYQSRPAGAGPASLAIRFEIAPPDKPEQFATYVEGTAHRAPD